MTWQEIMSITELQVSWVGGTWEKEEQKNTESGWDLRQGAGASRECSRHWKRMGWSRREIWMEDQNMKGKRVWKSRGKEWWGGKDLTGSISSLGSHTAHISLSHLLPHLSFLTFFPS